jgi:hypothetical protein
VGAVSDTGLADWLARQYDAEAAAARACLGEAFVNEDGERKDPGDAWPPPALKRYTQPLSERGPWPEWVVARVPFIETWSPQRVLAEIAAKRRRLDLHRPDPGWSNRCKICLSDRAGRHSEDWSADAWPCETILIDAALHAGRPGWKDEWALDAEAA